MNLYELENNLMGFQMGMLHDTIRLTDRFAIEGFLNAGVFYNQVKYSNVMGMFTTQTFADNTRIGSGYTRRRLEYREQRHSRHFRNFLHDRGLGHGRVPAQQMLGSARRLPIHVDGPYPHCRPGVSGQSERGQRSDVPGLARWFGVPALVARV